MEHYLQSTYVFIVRCLIKLKEQSYFCFEFDQAAFAIVMYDVTS